MNALLHGPAARYEGGTYLTDGRRSWLPGWVRDARFDADQATRRELVRKSRYFERNNAIVNRLADLFEQYTVGPTGLRFVPASSDQEWNKRAKDWWDKWCEMPDLTSRQSFATINSLAARTWFVDGEVFIVKTAGRPRANSKSYPRIQLIEGHRVDTPGAEAATSNIVDGISLDSRGRPMNYWVQDDEEGTLKPISAEDMVHVFEPSRVGMYRGLPMLYPVINDLHDLDDLQILEMDAAKENAEVTRVIKTKTGEDNDDAQRKAMFGIGGSGATGGTSGGSSNTRAGYYNEVFKGKAKVLHHDDDMAEFRSERPSVAVQAYWDYLASKVCAGVGISKLLVFPWSVQGTVVRADLDVASSFFRSRSHVLGAYFGDIYQYVLEWGVANDSKLADSLPSDWRRVTVRPPRSVNVDVGHNSKALIAEYAAGWRTLEEICAEFGWDWRDVLRQRATEFKEAAKLEQEFQLGSGTLIRAVLEALKQQAPDKEDEAQPMEAAA